MKRIGIFLLTLMLIASINVSGGAGYVSFDKDTCILNCPFYVDTFWVSIGYVFNLQDTLIRGNYIGNTVIGTSGIIFTSTDPGGIDSISPGDSQLVRFKIITENVGPNLIYEAHLRVQLYISYPFPEDSLPIRFVIFLDSTDTLSGLESVMETEKYFKIIQNPQGFKIKSNISDYKIKIFDLNGRKVPYRRKGNLYGVNACNGVYFIRIKYNDNVYLKKMIRFR